MEPKSGWKTSEFWLVAGATLFAAVSGGFALWYPEVALERLLAVNGLVGGGATAWTMNRKSVKREAVAAVVAEAAVDAAAAKA